jgi:membrane protein YqaA with SNARE-associated domain
LPKSCVNPLSAYATLAGSAFLAATIVPAQSELVLAKLLAEGAHSTPLLLLSATAANTLGSVVNWGLGRAMTGSSARRFLRIAPERLERGRRLYERWGAWSLLLAWVPFIGDPLTVVAGALRLRLMLFVPLVAIGKAARYAALAIAVLGI